MEINDYALEIYVRDRLTVARHAALIRALREGRRRRGLRVELGVALIALGHWLLGTPA